MLNTKYATGLRDELQNKSLDYILHTVTGWIAKYGPDAELEIDSSDGYLTIELTYYEEETAEEKRLREEAELWQKREWAKRKIKEDMQIAEKEKAEYFRLKQKFEGNPNA